MFNHKEHINKIGIYKITNLIDSKIYIGSTCDSLYKRLSTHRELLRKNKHTNKHLQRAFIKYTEANFSFDILEICLTKEDTLKREEFYINFLESFKQEKGYNIFQYSHTTKGNRWSKEAKDRRKGFGKGRELSLDTRKKQSIAAKGRIVKESTKVKLRDLYINPIIMLDLDGNYIREFRNCKEASLYFNLIPSGYVCSVLSRKRKTCKGYRLILKKEYDSNNIERIVSGCTKEVNQYDLQGNFIKHFLSFKEAEIELGIKGANSNISACCKNKRKNAYGYIWKYKS